MAEIIKNYQKLSGIFRNCKKHGKNVRTHQIKVFLIDPTKLLKHIQQIRIQINCLYGFLMKLPEVEE